MEGSYEYTPNVYDEDEEQSPQMHRSSITSQHETEAYDRKTSSNNAYPTQV